MSAKPHRFHFSQQTHLKCELEYGKFDIEIMPRRFPFEKPICSIISDFIDVHLLANVRPVCGSSPRQSSSRYK